MNVVLIEDSIGDIVEIRNYCSDFCAKFDSNYDGWYGCVEAETKYFATGAPRKLASNNSRGRRSSRLLSTTVSYRESAIALWA